MVDGIEQDGPPGPAEPHESGGERCSRCHAQLAVDQRYCLNCGARRGAPRIDFTAFWAPTLATAASQLGAPPQRAAKVPSRRLSCVLAGGVLALGVVAGVAIGPGGGSGEALAGITRSLVASGGAGLPAAHASAPSATTTTSPQQTSGGAPAEAPSAPVPRRRYKRREAAPATESPAPAETAPTATTQTEAHKPSSSPTSGSAHEPKPVPRPPITHVWLITLTQGAFAQAQADAALYPYLEKSLVPQGTLLTKYALVARSALANDIALLSGQAPNAATEAGCPTYSAVQPPTVSGSEGLASGSGCVYPSAVQTLAGELATAGLSWRGYAQDMASSAPGSTKTCVHPALGEASPSAPPVTGADYVLTRDPFVYFDSLLESGACASNVVDFSQFAPELANPTSAPDFSWLIPSACDDGASAPCAPAGSAAGSAPSDAFVQSAVEQIMASSEYHSHGLIVITFDSAPAALESPSGHTPVGALLLSPFVHHGTRVKQTFDAFSLLKSLERDFGVPPSGHAADPGLAEFGAKVYTAGPTH